MNNLFIKKFTFISLLFVCSMQGFSTLKSMEGKAVEGDSKPANNSQQQGEGAKRKTKAQKLEDRMQKLESLVQQLVQQQGQKPNQKIALHQKKSNDGKESLANQLDQLEEKPHEASGQQSQEFEEDLEETTPFTFTNFCPRLIQKLKPLVSIKTLLFVVFTFVMIYYPPYAALSPTSEEFQQLFKTGSTLICNGNPTSTEISRHGLLFYNGVCTMLASASTKTKSKIVNGTEVFDTTITNHCHYYLQSIGLGGYWGKITEFVTSLSGTKQILLGATITIPTVMAVWYTWRTWCKKPSKQQEKPSGEEKRLEGAVATN